MKFIYCPLCGNMLNEKVIGDEGMTKYCLPCDQPFFENVPSVVIALVLNERNQVLLLKSNYISHTHWTLVAGYLKNGETLEAAVAREVFEETNQHVESLEYVTSYYFHSPELIMPGFIARVKTREFGKSSEVDDIMWCNIEDVNKYINRENNMSGIHFDNSIVKLGMYI